MGRRSSHTPDELRELIIAEATKLIDTHGLQGLSARAIARQINYSPGTIYNVFKDLDELLFTIEIAMLDRLAAELRDVPRSGDPAEHVTAVVTTYASFTARHPRLWNVLMQHQPKNDTAPPHDFIARLEAVRREIETALAPVLAEQDEASARRASVTLWAALHGLVSFQANGKMQQVVTHDTVQIAQDLVAMVIRGFQTGTRVMPKRKLAPNSMV
jgi:AcrR family transcriptional regulator